MVSNPVIADAGPLIAFASIDALVVLQKLFSEICITEAVMNECMAKPGTDSQRIKAAIDQGWLVTLPPCVATEPLSPSLGTGESDSIRFGMQSPDEILFIVDDRLARRFALKQGINIVGTVRILDLAEQHDLIESAKLCIAEMSTFGYRVSLDLLKQIRSE